MSIADLLTTTDFMLMLALMLAGFGIGWWMRDMRGGEELAEMEERIRRNRKT